jgi:RNA polymerase sigma-70 factor (ECF subfamily)
LQTGTQSVSDEHIVGLCQNKNLFEKGFRLLMDRYQERLYWHIRRLVIDHDDANDVMQNCMIKVYRNIDKFEGKSQLYTWLYRIATNEAITFLNQKEKRTTSSIDEQEADLANRLRADAYFDGDATQLKLQLAIQTLPEKQRIVFNMRYFEEMNYQDMSEVLDTSVGALKASYHHAVKKIETFFQQN